jgi:hypothetical protein
MHLVTPPNSNGWNIPLSSIYSGENINDSLLQEGRQKVNLFGNKVIFFCFCILLVGFLDAALTKNVRFAAPALCASLRLSSSFVKAGSLRKNTALEYSTRMVQEGGRRCKKSTLNDLVHLTPLRIPLMNPP